MRFSSITLLASVASTIVASSTLTDDVELQKRQDSDPATQCHVSCGSTIRLARKDGYCKDETWLKGFNACLDCALTYDNIWAGYGNKVRAAATSCGLEASPKPIGGGPSSSAALPSATPVDTSSAAERTSSAPQTSSGSGTNSVAHPTLTQSQSAAPSTNGGVIPASYASTGRNNPGIANAVCC
ncbi:hypothetical protein HIM_06080 [Hirsutella minnesotensis 3608]|uniref:Uncharacterized protein n=1 Tax=Hirsutella minnesotensis 3608 TaxID=1043627 RepID=A0A0F8A504_9HYPO|nr:hypothetical protein HIM_06080 [Hirsutella minnesotensis 3608]